MVGSVLMQRMLEENDFNHIAEPVFFTTSQTGAAGPDIGKDIPALKDARDINELKQMDAIVSCQGGDYTTEVFQKLRESGWNGYWIDAASTLRMKDDATIVLDPVNRSAIDRALDEGRRDFIGGNCTVSLMMLALNGLFAEDLVEWITAMTYQAASGAGAQNMRELITQMGQLHASAADLLADPNAAILEIDRRVSDAMRSPDFATEHFGAPLAGSLIPWIDRDLGGGLSREEWKGDAECNKILGRPPNGPGHIPVESICVRIGAMRSHSQALTIKLRRDLPLPEIESLIAKGNEWIRYIENTKEASIAGLSPAAVTGKLDIAVGRVRKLAIGPEYISAFTVGDQLLWGAAEPLRRMLRILASR